MTVKILAVVAAVVMLGAVYAISRKLGWWDEEDDG